MPASSNIASTSSSSRESRWSSKQFPNGGNQMQVTTISKEGCFGRSKGNTDAAVIRLGHWSSGSSCSSTSHSTSSMSYSRSSMSSSTASSSSSSAMSSSSRSAISSSLDQRSSAQKQSSSSRSRSAILSSIGQTSSAQKQSLSSSSRSAISSSGDQVSNGEKQLSYSRSRSAISYTADQISSGEKQSSSSNSRSTTESSADQLLNAQNQTSLSSSRSSTSSSADQLSIEEKQLSYSRSRSAISSSGDQLSRREMQSSSSDSRSIISFSDDQMSSGEMQSSSSSSRSEILFSGDQILSAQKQSTSSNSRSAIAASDDSISSARNKSSSASSKSKISSSADQMLSAQKQSSLSNSRSAIAASDEQTLGAQKKSSVYSSKSAISSSVDQMSLEEKQTSSSSSKSEVSSSADQILTTQKQSKSSNTRSAIAVSDEQILSARNKSSLSCSKSEISSSADQMLGTQRQSKSSNSRSAIAASDEQTLNAQKKSSVYSSKSEISSSADQICAQKQSLSSSSRSQMSSSDDQMSSGQKQLSSFSSGIISSSIDQISVVQTQSSSSSRSVISSSFGQMSSAHKQSSLGAKSSLRKICSRSKAKEGCECVNLHGRLTECEIMWYRLRDLMLNIHTERADVIREICRISEDTMFRKWIDGFPMSGIEIKWARTREHFFLKNEYINLFHSGLIDRITYFNYTKERQRGSSIEESNYWARMRDRLDRESMSVSTSTCNQLQTITEHNAQTIKPFEGLLSGGRGQVMDCVEWLILQVLEIKHIRKTQRIIDLISQQIEHDLYRWYNEQNEEDSQGQNESLYGRRTECRRRMRYESKKSYEETHQFKKEMKLKYLHKNSMHFEGRALEVLLDNIWDVYCCELKVKRAPQMQAKSYMLSICSKTDKILPEKSETITPLLYGIGTIGDWGMCKINITGSVDATKAKNHQNDSIYNEKYKKSPTANVTCGSGMIVSSSSWQKYREIELINSKCASIVHKRNTSNYSNKWTNGRRLMLEGRSIEKDCNTWSRTRITEINEVTEFAKICKSIMQLNIIDVPLRIVDGIGQTFCIDWSRVRDRYLKEIAAVSKYVCDASAQSLEFSNSQCKSDYKNYSLGKGYFGIYPQRTTGEIDVHKPIVNDLKFTVTLQNKLIALASKVKTLSIGLLKHNELIFTHSFDEEENAKDEVSVEIFEEIEEIENYMVESESCDMSLSSSIVKFIAEFLMCDDEDFNVDSEIAEYLIMSKLEFVDFILNRTLSASKEETIFINHFCNFFEDVNRIENFVEMVFQSRTFDASCAKKYYQELFGFGKMELINFDRSHNMELVKKQNSSIIEANKLSLFAVPEYSNHVLARCNNEYLKHSIENSNLFTSEKHSTEMCYPELYCNNANNIIALLFSAKYGCAQVCNLLYIAVEDMYENASFTKAFGENIIKTSIEKAIGSKKFYLSNAIICYFKYFEVDLFEAVLNILRAQVIFQKISMPICKLNPNADFLHNIISNSFINSLETICCNEDVDLQKSLPYGIAEDLLQESLMDYVTEMQALILCRPEFEKIIFQESEYKEENELTDSIQVEFQNRSISFKKAYLFTATIYASSKLQTVSYIKSQLLDAPTFIGDIAVLCLQISTFKGQHYIDLTQMSSIQSSREDAINVSSYEHILAPLESQALESVAKQTCNHIVHEIYNDKQCGIYSEDYNYLETCDQLESTLLEECNQNIFINNIKFHKGKNIGNHTLSKSECDCLQYYHADNQRIEQMEFAISNVTAINNMLLPKDVTNTLLGSNYFSTVDSFTCELNPNISNKESPFKADPIVYNFEKFIVNLLPSLLSSVPEYDFIEFEEYKPFEAENSSYTSTEICARNIVLCKAYTLLQNLNGKSVVQAYYFDAAQTSNYENFAKFFCEGKLQASSLKSQVFSDASVFSAVKYDLDEEPEISFAEDLFLESEIALASTDVSVNWKLPQKLTFPTNAQYLEGEYNFDSIQNIYVKPDFEECHKELILRYHEINKCRPVFNEILSIGDEEKLDYSFLTNFNQEYVDYAFSSSIINSHLHQARKSPLDIMSSSYFRFLEADFCKYDDDFGKFKNIDEAETLIYASEVNETYPTYQDLLSTSLTGYIDLQEQESIIYDEEASSYSSVSTYKRKAAFNKSHANFANIQAMSSLHSNYFTNSESTEYNYTLPVVPIYVEQRQALTPEAYITLLICSCTKEHYSEIELDSYEDFPALQTFIPYSSEVSDKLIEHQLSLELPANGNQIEQAYTVYENDIIYPVEFMQCFGSLYYNSCLLSKSRLGSNPTLSKGVSQNIVYFIAEDITESMSDFGILNGYINAHMKHAALNTMSTFGSSKLAENSYDASEILSTYHDSEKGILSSMLNDHCLQYERYISNLLANGSIEENLNDYEPEDFESNSLTDSAHNTNCTSNMMINKVYKGVNNYSMAANSVEQVKFIPICEEIFSKKDSIIIEGDLVNNDCTNVCSAIDESMSCTDFEYIAYNAADEFQSFIESFTNADACVTSSSLTPFKAYDISKYSICKFLADYIVFHSVNGIHVMNNLDVAKMKQLPYLSMKVTEIFPALLSASGVDKLHYSKSSDLELEYNFNYAECLKTNSLNGRHQLNLKSITNALAIFEDSEIYEHSRPISKRENLAVTGCITQHFSSMLPQIYDLVVVGRTSCSKLCHILDNSAEFIESNMPEVCTGIENHCKEICQCIESTGFGKTYKLSSLHKEIDQLFDEEMICVSKVKTVEKRPLPRPVFKTPGIDEELEEELITPSTKKVVLQRLPRMNDIAIFNYDENDDNSDYNIIEVKDDQSTADILEILEYINEEMDDNIDLSFDEHDEDTKTVDTLDEKEEKDEFINAMFEVKTVSRLTSAEKLRYWNARNNLVLEKENEFEHIDASEKEVVIETRSDDYLNAMFEVKTVSRMSSAEKLRYWNARNNIALEKEAEIEHLDVIEKEEIIETRSDDYLNAMFEVKTVSRMSSAEKLGYWNAKNKVALEKEAEIEHLLGIEKEEIIETIDDDYLNAMFEVKTHSRLSHFDEMQSANIENLFVKVLQRKQMNVEHEVLQERQTKVKSAPLMQMKVHVTRRMNNSYSEESYPVFQQQL